MSPPACAKRHECARAHGHDAELDGKTACTGTACPRFAALRDELMNRLNRGGDSLLIVPSEYLEAVITR
jgi:hypothetical protein